MTSQVKLSLLHLSEIDTKGKEYECAICYKRINTNVFICEKPCNKIFHPACLEKTLEQCQESAHQAGEEIPEYKCCYCRRHIDMPNYEMEIFLRRLLQLKAGGYDVNDAMIKANELIDSGENYDDFEFNIYNPVDISYKKKPKISKRAEFKVSKQGMRSGGGMRMRMRKR